MDEQNINWGDRSGMGFEVRNQLDWMLTWGFPPLGEQGWDAIAKRVPEA
jgi:hypothetical protein